jgi:hypothetical protein
MGNNEMKIPKKEFINGVRENRMREHLVFHGLTNALDGHKGFTDWMSESKFDEIEEVDVKLTVEGVEIDLDEFVEHWQKQVKSSIAKEAQSLLDDKLREIEESLGKVSEMINDEAKYKIGKALGIDPKDAYYFESDC